MSTGEERLRCSRSEFDFWLRVSVGLGLAILFEVVTSFELEFAASDLYSNIFWLGHTTVSKVTREPWSLFYVIYYC